jgi:hypothetical protein
VFAMCCHLGQMQFLFPHFQRSTGHRGSWEGKRELEEVGSKPPTPAATRRYIQVRSIIPTHLHVQCPHRHPTPSDPIWMLTKTRMAGTGPYTEWWPSNLELRLQLAMKFASAVFITMARFLLFCCLAFWARWEEAIMSACQLPITQGFRQVAGIECA